MILMEQQRSSSQQQKVVKYNSNYVYTNRKNKNNTQKKKKSIKIGRVCWLNFTTFFMSNFMSFKTFWFTLCIHNSNTTIL